MGEDIGQPLSRHYCTTTGSTLAFLLISTMEMPLSFGWQNIVTTSAPHAGEPYLAKTVIARAKTKTIRFVEQSSPIIFALTTF
jgi:hypothetical protein